jgi:PhnB protein
MKLNSYLNFNGNCRAAFEYYAKHLNGKVLSLMTHDEAPGGTAIPGWGAAVLHGRLEIGGTELWAADVPPERQQPMRSVYLHLDVDDEAEAERVFTALADGGQILTPLAETFWARRFGSVRDQFGTLWMIGANRPMPPRPS